MTENNINDLKRKIEDAVDDFQRGISNMEEAIERYQRLLDTTLCDELNKLIAFGFVPGAKLKFDGNPYIFKGYTEGLGMQFINIDGSIINGPSVDVTYKYLNRWAKQDNAVKDEAQENKEVKHE